MQALESAKERFIRGAVLPFLVVGGSAKANKIYPEID